MKKFFTLLMICALVLLTGCGSSQDSDAKKDQTSSSPEYKIGMIIHLNATESKVAELYAEAMKQANIESNKSVVKYYDNLKLMQMGLDANDVDTISVYKCVASYLIASTGNKYVNVEGFKSLALADSFCFAVRKEDSALKADLDKTIDAMKADGTLDKLVKTYITDAKAGKIAKVDIPKIDGAPTIKVGVTGDLPPLDLVLEDGSPAGFNTAMLAEIAKRLNRNIEIVQIASGARAAALASDQIDVIFWAVVPNSKNFPNDIDKPEGVEFSVPYFQDSVAHIELKK